MRDKRLYFCEISSTKQFDEIQTYSVASPAPKLWDANHPNGWLINMFMSDNLMMRMMVTTTMMMIMPTMMMMRRRG